MDLEMIIAGLVLAGAGFLIARKPKLQLVGLHIFLITAVIGMIFFGLIHLWWMVVMCMCGLAVCIQGINVRLPNKKEE